MAIIEKPDRLFHYTSIDTLAKILTSRRLRFNRLDRADDVTEASWFPDQRLAKALYISAWTYDHEENLALWASYGIGAGGVRVSLPTEMFNAYMIQLKHSDLTEEPVTIESAIPPETFHELGATFIPPLQFVWNENVRPVEYRSDAEYVKRQAHSYAGQQGIHFSKDLPFIKHSDWAIQREIRFIITAFFDGLQTEVTAESALIKARRATDFYVRGIPPAFDYLDIPLNEHVLRHDIEVVLGGKCHEGHKEMVRLLLNEHTDVGEKALRPSTFQIR